MKKTLYLKEKDIAKKNKEQLIKIATEHNIVLMGIKASMLWTERFKNDNKTI